MATHAAARQRTIHRGQAVRALSASSPLRSRPLESQIVHSAEASPPSGFEQKAAASSAPVVALDDPLAGPAFSRVRIAARAQILWSQVSRPAISLIDAHQSDHSAKREISN